MSKRVYEVEDFLWIGAFRKAPIAVALLIKMLRLYVCWSSASVIFYTVHVCVKCKFVHFDRV